MGSFLDTYNDSGFWGVFIHFCLIRSFPFLEILSTPVGFTRYSLSTHRIPAR